MNNGPWRLFHAHRIRHNGLPHREIFGSLCGPDYTSKRYSEDLDHCSPFVKYFILLHFIRMHCRETNKPGEYYIPPRQDRKDSIIQAIREKVFLKIIDTPRKEECLKFYCRKLNVKAPEISPEEQEEIDLTISDYFNKAKLLTNKVGLLSAKLPLTDQREIKQLRHQGIAWERLDGTSQAENRKRRISAESNHTAEIEQHHEEVQKAKEEKEALRPVSPVAI